MSFSCNHFEDLSAPAGLVNPLGSDLAIRVDKGIPENFWTDINQSLNRFILKNISA